jgi:hypothetical protein
LEPITPEALLFDFDCGNEDLNSFYKKDLWHHEEALITKSYIFSPEGEGNLGTQNRFVGRTWADLS